MSQMRWDMGGFTETYPGWIPPEERSPEEEKAHRQFLDDTPTVGEIFTGSSYSGSERPRNWEVARKAYEMGYIPKEWMRANSGTQVMNLKNINQLIGSCVGFGAGTMALYASVIDAMIRQQPEAIMIPFVPYHYGRGRYHAGIRGSGSGSTGSGQAKALAVDGIIAWNTPGVPAPSWDTASVKWTAQIETKYSNGANIPDELIAEGRKHLFPTAARVASTEELKTLLDSHYTATCASNWGGLMKCPVDDGVLLSRRATTWNHQMSVLDYLIHAKHGLLFYINNQWAYPHGVCPTGAPEGGFWVKENEMAKIIAQRETFAFADPNGFEDRSRKLRWFMA